MKLEDFPFEVIQLPCAMPVWHARTDAAHWRRACEQVREKGGRLVALWAADRRDSGEGFAVYAALTVRSGLLVVTALAEDERYPDISDLFPAAGRMQRAAYDLLGVRADAAQDTRKWLRHGAWPEDVFPLRRDFPSAGLPDAANGPHPDNYPFVRVEGRRRARDSRGAGACRDHRAGSLPLFGRG